MAGLCARLAMLLAAVRARALRVRSAQLVLLHKQARASLFRACAVSGCG